MIRTGVARVVVVPSPSCPTLLRPQHSRFPFVLIPQVCLLPAMSLDQGPASAISLGVSLPVEPLMPISLRSPLPPLQQQHEQVQASEGRELEA